MEAKNRAQYIEKASALLVLNPPEIREFTRELHKPEHAGLIEDLKIEYSKTYLCKMPEDLLTVMKGLCTHFGVLLDGHYSEDDLLKLADKLTQLLRESRVPVLLRGRSKST